MFRHRQSLVFDADDTLWENNVYFEAAFEQFCEFLAHSSMSPVEVRSVLDEIEIANVKIHGYGSHSFARNLADCYRRLAQRHISQADLTAVMDFARSILERPMELIAGVRETILELAERHSLTIFTKGDREEQQLKIDRSGLGRFFDHAAIVKEKNEQAYRCLALERNFDAANTWMIGNSPKSDICPALAAGLKAVFVPHARTWGLELAALPENHPNLLTVGAISELTAIF